MKKTLKKLELNKRTIANLNSTKMNEKVGGQITVHCHGGFGGKTVKGQTCVDHVTCYTCQTCYLVTC